MAKIKIGPGKMPKEMEEKMDTEEVPDTEEMDSEDTGDTETETPEEENQDVTSYIESCEDVDELNSIMSACKRRIAKLNKE